MATKGVVALVFCILAGLLFFGWGFQFIDHTKYDLVAIGLGCLTTGYSIHTFVPPGA